MENNAMSLPWKLIFQKTNLKYFILFLLCISFFVGISLITNDSCSINRAVISNEVTLYEKSSDPEFCENLLERIDSYNDQCLSQIEILDCG